MNTANWIELKTNHYLLSKSLNIRRRFGWQGYGIYMALLQKLASEENRAFALIEIPALTFDFQCDEKELTAIINNYFDCDEMIFWSDELNELMKKYDESYIKYSEGGKISAGNLTPEERKEKARKAANARWNKKDINAN